MRAAAIVALDAVLSAERGERRELALHGDHRQAVFGHSVVWLSPDGAAHEKAVSQMWRPSCAAIDASDAVIANLSRAQHQQETPGAQYPYLLKGLAINRPNQGLARRHHLYPDGALVPVFGSHHGLVYTQGSGLAAVEHAGNGLLRRGSKGGACQIWPAGDLQHRSGIAVHQQRLDR